MHTGWALAQFGRPITQPAVESERNGCEKAKDEHQRAVV